MLGLILAAAAAVIAYCLLVLSSPHHRCPKCRGKRVVIRRGRRKPSTCPRCKGRGKTQRFGAGAVHRFYWSVKDERKRANADGDGGS